MTPEEQIEILRDALGDIYDEYITVEHPDPARMAQMARSALAASTLGTVEPPSEPRAEGEADRG